MVKPTVGSNKIQNLLFHDFLLFRIQIPAVFAPARASVFPAPLQQAA
jgi:hypothetical protein